MQENKLVNKINKKIISNLNEIYDKNVELLHKDFPNIENDIQEVNKCFFIPVINFFNKLDKNIFVQKMKNEIFEDLSNIQSDNNCLLFMDYLNSCSELSSEFKLSEIKEFSNITYLNNKINNLSEIQLSIDTINKDFVNDYYAKLIQIKLINKYIKSVIPNYIFIDQNYAGEYSDKYIIKINFKKFILKINLSFSKSKDNFDTDNYINFNIFPKKSLLKEICQYLEQQGLYNLRIVDKNRILIKL